MEERILIMHVPSFEGHWRRIMTFEGSYLIGFNCNNRTVQVANPLAGEAFILPQLPEWARYQNPKGFFIRPKLGIELGKTIVIYAYRDRYLKTGE